MDDTSMRLARSHCCPANYEGLVIKVIQIETGGLIHAEPSRSLLTSSPLICSNVWLYAPTTRATLAPR
ncbi:hypothetical protein Hamer_G007292 [Homarus americanus]|uniref:Uncharacterized protein n=1 Tax=Homarus americanus TaxID=6706 RepID=A0A8J5JWC4_HOMAM|nr:hypothetical protein Hamer_G007292 [Homarus americanus]